MPKNIIQPIEHIPLHCPLCKKRFLNLLGQPLPNHNQVRCSTTDGNEMDIGICNKCINAGISLDTLQGVLEGIKVYWVYEIDTNKNMKEKEKKERKEFHNSHVLQNVLQIYNSGKEAEKDARKKGSLI